MIHLGDITKVSGYTAPPVDCIIGGSPCQDLSVAGRQAGLSGARSGLFMEQIRIVKEMRDADRKRGRAGQFIRPRYMVWENVPGALSSNKGQDFRTVLEEIIKVVEDNPPIPFSGKWPLADAYYGDGWSIAYRVLDSQFWGVPQRRRRIALVADFGGHTAPEILFERNRLSWDTPEGAEAWEGPPAGAGRGADPSDTSGGVIALNDQGGQVMDVSVEKTGTLRAQEHGHQPIIAFTQNQRNEVRDLHDVAGSLAAEPGMKQQTFVCAGFKAGNGSKANGIGYELEVTPTLSAASSGTNQVPAVICMATQQGGAEIMTDDKAPTLTAAGMSGNNQPVICLQGNAIDRNVGQHGSGISYEPMFTLNATDHHAVYDARGNGDGETVPTITGDHENRVTDYTALVMATGQANAEILADKSPTLNCNHEAPIVFDKEVYNSGDGAAGGHYISEGGPAPTMRTHKPAGVCSDGTVRRLTPLECERLQGFPDGWTDIGDWTDEKGKVHKTSDAARYKALGNSIALPPWKWVLKRLCALYERDATMGSLFDGIGGFSLLWERLNGPGTCLWASEIEPFCIAVTRCHFVTS